MANLPKLKVKGMRPDIPDEIRDFEQARYFPFESDDVMITVENEVVRSYDEMLKLASRPELLDREYLEVAYIPIVEGG